MSAREAILNRLRRATQGGGDAAAIKAWAQGGANRVTPALAQTEGAERVAQFAAKARAADASISHIPDIAALPGALAEELRARNLPAVARTGSEPLFQGLDWGAVAVSQGVGRVEEPVTLSRAEMGMAETGTVVLASGPDNPVTLTFLGETHFVILRADDIQAGYEDMWAELRRRGLTPRTVNLVTGPSRSADIGQTLQLGAHGPVALHVFVVDGDEDGGRPD
jgi:L-lactate utilization protein LutC